PGSRLTGPARLEGRAALVRHQRRAERMTTVLGATTVLPYGANNPSLPATVALPDDTVLIAWQDLSGGTIIVTHYSRDLSQSLGQATVTGAADNLGMAMFPRGDGATLATSTQKWHIT